MSRFHIMPDLEAVAAQALRDGGIPGLDERVFSSIPGTPTWPLVVVQRTGGIPAVRQYLDKARIQLDIWGGARGTPDATKKSDILDIAQMARSILFELEGQAVGDPVDVFVTAVEDATGLAWLPDPDTGRDRYTFSVWLYGRAVQPDENEVEVYNLNLYRGASFTRRFRIGQGEGFAVLDGYTAAAQIREQRSQDYPVLYEFDPVIDEDEISWYVELSIDDEVTDTFEFTHGFWDLELAIDEEVDRVLQGRVIVHGEVTY